MKNKKVQSTMPKLYNAGIAKNMGLGMNDVIKSSPRIGTAKSKIMSKRRMSY